MCGGVEMSDLLRVENLTKHFAVQQSVLGSRLGGSVQAVTDVSFTVKEGETLGLVGESGCGKSTTGRCLIRLTEPTAGSILFEDRDIRELRGKDLKAFRRQAQFIFQDPYASLNPRMTIGEIVTEPLVIHNEGTRAGTGIPGQGVARRRRSQPRAYQPYPHEFSAGSASVSASPGAGSQSEADHLR